MRLAGWLGIAASFLTFAALAVLNPRAPTPQAQTSAVVTYQVLLTRDAHTRTHTGYLMMLGDGRSAPAFDGLKPGDQPTVYFKDGDFSATPFTATPLWGAVAWVIAIFLLFGSTGLLWWARRRQLGVDVDAGQDSDW